MKNLVIFVLSFFIYLSGFAQVIEKRYFESNSELGGDVLIKSSSFKVEKERLYMKDSQLKFKEPKSQALHKTKSGQDWWQPDTVYYFYTNTSMSNSRIIQKYNSQGLLAVSINQRQGINSWENSSSVTYTYDSSNNKITELQQNWQNNSWVNTTLITCTYDSNNNKLTELYKYGDTFSSLETYAYDSNNNIYLPIYFNIGRIIHGAISLKGLILTIPTIICLAIYFKHGKMIHGIIPI